MASHDENAEYQPEKSLHVREISAYDKGAASQPEKSLQNFQVNEGNFQQRHHGQFDQQSFQGQNYRQQLLHGTLQTPFQQFYHGPVYSPSQQSYNGHVQQFYHGPLYASSQQYNVPLQQYYHGLVYEPPQQLYNGPLQQFYHGPVFAPPQQLYNGPLQQFYHSPVREPSQQLYNEQFQQFYHGPGPVHNAPSQQFHKEPYQQIYCGQWYQGSFQQQYQQANQNVQPFIQHGNCEQNTKHSNATQQTQVEDSATKNCDSLLNSSEKSPDETYSATVINGLQSTANLDMISDNQNLNNKNYGPLSGDDSRNGEQNTKHSNATQQTQVENSATKNCDSLLNSSEKSPDETYSATVINGLQSTANLDMISDNQNLNNKNYGPLSGDDSKSRNGEQNTKHSNATQQTQVENSATKNCDSLLNSSEKSPDETYSATVINGLQSTANLDMISDNQNLNNKNYGPLSGDDSKSTACTVKSVNSTIAENSTDMNIVSDFSLVEDGSTMQSLNTITGINANENNVSELVSAKQSERIEFGTVNETPEWESKNIKLTQLGNNFYDEEGYIYSQVNPTAKNSYFRCKYAISCQCLARASAKGRAYHKSTLNYGHSHDPNPALLDQLKFDLQLDKEVEENGFATKRDLYHNAIDRVEGLSDPLNIPLLSQKNSTLHRRKKRFIPVLPKSVAQFEQILTNMNYETTFTKSTRNLPFYRGVWTKKENEENIVYISESVLKIFNTLESGKIRCDGTFKALPRSLKFCQLFIISVTYRNRSYPLAYILMKKKNFHSYDIIFTKLKEVITVNITEVMADYEPATRKAVTKHFPGARLCGCYFHYCQAIRKNAKRFGLSKDSRFATAIKQICALALLPSNFVFQGFKCIDRRITGSTRWKRFSSYWENQWKNSHISVFNLIDRTNNFAESFNKSLNLLLKSKNPNIWTLIYTLKKLERDKANEIEKSYGGLMIKTQRNKKTISLDEQIKEATDRFKKDGDIESFLSHATNQHFDFVLNEQIDIDDNEDDDIDQTVIPNSFYEETTYFFEQKTAKRPAEYHLQSKAKKPRIALCNIVVN